MTDLEKRILETAERLHAAARRCSLDRPLSYAEYDAAWSEWMKLKEELQP